MASHFETLAKAKKEFKERTGQDFDKKEVCGITIFNRNKNRRKRKQKLLKRPYFVGSYMEWLNL